jgi:hypothetical protein
METNENLKIWNLVKQPPATALRQITAGRLKGKSDINPEWRYRVMTEVFGICGVGWKFEIVKTWTEPGPDNQVFSCAQINLYIKLDGVWSDAIPGVGGHMLIVKESSGLHANDEGYKMAITDALGTAMKMLGVAGDIYAGLWDGSKYNEPAENKPPQCKPIQNQSGPVPGSNRWITDKIKELDIDEAKVMEFINKTLHLPIEESVKTTLEKLTQTRGIKDSDRAAIAKKLNATEGVKHA